MNTTFFNSINTLRNIVTRSYAFKSDLKIKWNRPEKIPCYDPRKSGDLVPLSKIEDNNIMISFQQSKELQSADESVRRLFQLKNNRRGESIKIASNSLIGTVQRHALDYGSHESKLAAMTVRVRNLQEIMFKYPRNARLKVQLKELIDKRKKFLNYLRRWDYKRFEWALEKLDMEYKSPPPKFHWITRKESLRKLTDQHCDNIKEQRLNEYRKSLESQQIDFLINKIKKLQLMQNLQNTYKIPVTITNENINEVKKQLAELRKVLNPE